jgi:dTDP-4-amino-4,6-dideoxygalactose transaminase
MHLMPPYINDQAHCPVAEDITARGINLPTHALLTFKDVEYICARVKKHVIGK